MRPEIRGLLEQRIEEIYEEAGYGTATELVRDAVRSHLNELEASVTDERTIDDEFTVRQLPASNSPPEIRMLPTSDSDIELERFETADKDTVVLDTGTAYLGAATIESALSAIEGIEFCAVPEFGGDIRLFVAETNERPLERLVSDAFDRLYRLIDQANTPVRDGELSRTESLAQVVGDGDA